ncbi:5364_t:CDS:2 [Diversispora eburnea]|uniref:5364_t:CDS:1 n=1 Tax=Diversispora eburnea TaxID=1213867 RepID=A0A9N9AGE9_9GLOM|nr:5364_t:CDS:2 [Diversispora eburnea]
MSGHLVKEITEKKLYEEIERILKMRNKSVLNNSIIRKLEAILQSDYSVITSKIIVETEVEDNENNRGCKDIHCRMYFTVLRAFRNSFPDIKYEWIEKYVRSIKDATEMLDIEISGQPFNSTKKRTVRDAKKLLLIPVCQTILIVQLKMQNNIEHIAFKQLVIAENNGEDLRE